MGASQPSANTVRALVTGGAGFIGSHIVDALLAKGCTVVALDDLSTGRKENLREALAMSNGRCSLVQADIASGDTTRVVADFKPTAIFHHAAQMNVRRSVSEPGFDAQVNVVGTVNLLEAARIAGVRSFIFASSGGAIYGDQERYPATEEDATRPESAYGVSKLCGEHYLRYFSRLYGFRAVALRYANVYGPRQNAKGEAGVVAIFCERLNGGEALKINGDGEQTRDFVYVDDVVAANLCALERFTTPGFSLFNIGTGVEKSVKQIAETLGRTSGKTFRTEHGPALAGEQRRSVIDPKSAEKELRWRPTVDFESGLKRTWESFRK